MRSYTLLVVSALVLCARAATIPAPAVPAAPALELALLDAKPLENVHSEQELIDQVNEVKDIDNNLRKVPHNVDAIPVKIVNENAQPSLKTGAEEDKTQLDDVAAEVEPEIKRVKVDISNTGEPQRQEHDSQSPGDQNEEQQSVATIKQTISETQNAINQGFQGVSSEFQNWFTNNEQFAAIQQSIQNLQLNFQNQLTKLNSTIQGFWQPEQAASSTATETEPTGTPTATGTKTIMENVEKGLEVIENNFEYGVKSMVKGVQNLAQVKADNETGSGTNNPLNGFSQYVTQLQNSISEGFTNLQASFQQFVNQNQQNSNANNTSTGPLGFFQNLGSGFQNIINSQNGGAATTPSGTVSDEAAGTTVRPTIWQGFQSSFQNIFTRPGQSTSQNQQTVQNNQNTVGSGPIATAFQNNPLVQGVVNLIQRPTEETPAAQGTNSVPATNEKPEETKPDADQQQKEKPEGTPPAQPTPLQQIVQRNPIMQGLAGAVHKIQTTIVNPEKPRDDKDTKAGWYGGYGHSPAQGNNNNSNGVEGGKSETPKEEIPAAIPAKEKDCDKKRTDTEKTVPDKTES